MILSSRRSCFVYPLLLEVWANLTLGLSLPNSPLPITPNNITSLTSSRTPDFKTVIKNGNDIVNNFLYGGIDHGLLRKVVNYVPIYYPTRKLDDFTQIQMEFVINQRQSVKLAHQPDKWNSWQSKFEPGFQVVPPRIAELRFKVSDVAMDEAEALQILKDNDEDGPWSVIQLCKPAVTGRIAYAFADFISGPGRRPAPGEDPELVWTMVDVLDKGILTCIGDPCSNYLPSFVAQTNGTIMMSHTNNVTLPGS